MAQQPIFGSMQPEGTAAAGKVIEASKIRKSSKVRVHYIKDGNDMVVDRVIYTDKD